MRVLYIDPMNDGSMMAQYATMLQEMMDKYVDTRLVHDSRQFKSVFNELCPHIVHVHGCLVSWTYQAANYARKHGARVVITPHGQMEPWVTKGQSFQDKLPKFMYFERRMISKAYALIVMGQMEADSVKQLGWNSRIVIIRNPLITASVNENEMTRQMLQLYQKVIDSDVLKQMTTDDCQMLASLLKANITGNERWLSQEEKDRIAQQTDDKAWRRILLYAEHEHVRDLVDRGMLVLNMPIVDINTKSIESFFPDHYVLPEKIISNRKGTANEIVLRILKGIQRDLAHQRLPLLHLVELSTELRNPRLKEDQLVDTLKNKKLYSLLAHLLPLLEEQTGLSEGFMPIIPVEDRKTRKIRTILAKNLEI